MNDATTPSAAPEALTGKDGLRLAYVRHAGRLPGVVFLGGFRSSMQGVKAVAFEAHCLARQQAFVRFDYFGHGASNGRFEDGTVGRWTDDALAVLDNLTDGPQILVGSSLGAWLAILAALQRPRRVAGLLGISAAVDFTAHLEQVLFGDEEHAQLRDRGRIDVPDCHGGPPFAITQRLIEEARHHLLLPRAELPVEMPVRLLHGQRDRDVPWQTSLQVAERLTAENVRVLLIKDGEHDLSRPADIAQAFGTLDELIALCR
jgi:pimeloyl-ACP methyl ester carboxylesterase